MSQIEIKNAEGQAAGTVELSSDVFGVEPNIPVIHQVVTVQLGNPSALPRAPTTVA